MKRKTRSLSRISSTANTQTNPTQHYVPVEMKLLLMTRTFEQLAEYLVWFVSVVKKRLSVHLVARWNPQLLNKFLPRIPMLLLQLGNFLFEPSTSQGAQAQGHVFCQELQLRNNTTGKSLNHGKKAQQTKPEAFADLTAAAVSAPAGWLEPVRDAWQKKPAGSLHKAGWSWGKEPLPGWLSSWQWPPSHWQSVPERKADFYNLGAFESKCFMISTRDADINKCRMKYSSQVDGLDHTDRLRLYHTAIKYRLKSKNNLFSHPAEPLNGFQQWVGHKAVFLKWKYCSYFLL